MTNEQLVTLIRAGSDEAENMLALWEQNKGMIRKIASQYRYVGEAEDLQQEGYLGLCEAVNHYDPAAGVQFITYAAYWIRQKISRYVKKDASIKLPEHAKNRLREYQKMCSEWLMNYGRNPSRGEICHYLQISKEILDHIEKIAQMDKIQSLDIPIGEEGSDSMYEVIPGHCTFADDVEEQIDQEQLSAVLWPLVDALPGKQPAVIKMRYQENATLEEIGRMMGVTHNTARNIEQSALKELRKPSRRSKLTPFVEDMINSISLSGNSVESFNRTWTSSTERAALWAEERIEEQRRAVEKELRLLEKRKRGI